MNKNFASLLIVCLPLFSGCIDDVPLAAKVDGGADVPASTLTDAPAMDSPPPAVCAACGGPSGINCLYAPGCGAVQRVCAPNTCGDAVAIEHCGCDGRTFVSGCLTPDRPFLHTGACGGGTDAGPLADAPGLGYCPEEVDHNAPQNPDLRYRRAAFAVPPDTGTRLEPGAVDEVSGTWAGTRQLGTPVMLGCFPGDTRDACRASTVIRVRANGGDLHEYVVAMAPEELAALTVGTPVAMRATATRWDGATPLQYSGELQVWRGPDSRMVLDIVTSDQMPQPLPELIAVGDAVCVSRPEPLCHRTLVAYEVIAGGRVAPGESAMVASSAGRYRLTNRVTYRRRFSGGAECTDVTPSVYSYEFVRQPDL